MKINRVLSIAALALAAVVGFSSGQSAYNRSAFENVMDDAIKNLRVVVGSLIAEDWAKAQTSAEALGGTAKKIRGMTPKVAVDRLGEFQAHADSLAATSTLIAVAAKAHDRDAAALGLGRLVQTCMGCHSVFRK